MQDSIVKILLYVSGYDRMTVAVQCRFEILLKNLPDISYRSRKINREDTLKPGPVTKRIILKDNGNIRRIFLVFMIPALGALLSINILQEQNLLSQTGFSIYQNPVYKFKIEYPSNWEKLEFTQGIEEQQRNIVVNFVSPISSSTPTFREYLLIEVGNLTLSSSQNPTLDEYTNKIINLRKSLPNFQLIESTPTLLSGGYQAKKIEYSYSNPIVGTTKALEVITTIDNNKVYLLSYNADAGRFNSYLPTVQKMIDSLRINA